MMLIGFNVTSNVHLLDSIGKVVGQLLIVLVMGVEEAMLDQNHLVLDLLKNISSMTPITRV